MADTASVNLGNRRELFLDRFLVERLDGARLVLHEPRDEGPVLAFDRPWEGPFCAYASVFQEGDRYRLYYRGLPAASDELLDSCTCYAESPDGVNWTRPALGLYEWRGSRANNIVLARDAAAHSFSPFPDLNPAALPEQHYKGMGIGGHGRHGLIPYASPDGLRWTPLTDQPVITRGHFDSQNVAFWSATEECYLCYCRYWTGGKVGLGFRSISRATSSNSNCSISGPMWVSMNLRAGSQPPSL